MPLLIEDNSKNSIVDDICPICNKPKKNHTFAEIQECSKKLKDIEKSGR